MTLKQFLNKSFIEPFPLFFVTGWIMGIVFIGAWPLFGFFRLIDYPGIMHSQGVISLFVGSFAIGFLLTALPRFTGSSAASFMDVTILYLFILLEALTLMSGYFAAANLLMSLKFMYVFYFAYSRARNKTLVPPPGFIWVGFALLSVTLGGLGLFAVNMGFEPALPLFPLFKLLVFRGFLISLFMGIGSRIVPFLTFIPKINSINFKSISHVIAAITFFLGLSLEALSNGRTQAQVGLSLQGISLLFEIGFLWCLYKLPKKETRSVLLWISSWLFASGPILSALWPQYSLHLMHMTFVGGFAAGTVTIASHVIVSHKGLSKNLVVNFWPLGTVWLILILASITRATAVFTNYQSHLNYAGSMVVIALVLWAAYFFKMIFA